DMVLEASITGQPPERHGNRSRAHAPQGMYRCAGDDRWVAITIDNDAAWQRFVDMVDRPALRDSSYTALDGRRAAHDAIDAEIAAWTGERDRFEVAEQLQRAGIPSAPMMTNGDLVE